MNLNPLRGGKRPRLRRGLAATGALALVSGLMVALASQASAAAGCRVDYQVNQWGNGFTANVVLTNLGDPVSNWRVQWNFAGNQQITNAWNGTVSQSGQSVTLSNAAWNGSLGTNASVNPGFQATYSGTNATPASFSMNGTVCTGTVGPTTAAPTTPGNPPTTTPGNPPTTTPGNPPTTSVPPGSHAPHVANPYAGATVYVNPDWAANAAAEPGGTRISNQPTGIWMDRIAAIAGVNGAMGMRAHLDNAVSMAGSGTMAIQFVIYNLPGRDCAALASQGELGATELGRYQTEYIDPIAAIQADPKYGNIRIINIVEIDSLPNLVTNAGSQAGATEACRTMLANGNYVKGVQYALSKLHAAGSNIYNYIDAGHHAWLGWSSNFGPSADLFASTIQGATGGWATVDGFIANTANYSALSEPYAPITATVNGTSVRQSKWYDWNDYADELTYAQALGNLMRQKAGSAGSGLGMLIDTSRNGWGGSARPTGPSTDLSSVDNFVNKSRIDRRIHPGNWCNQSGAGLGERPRANPASGIDAYVWIKPPGESDGASTFIPNPQNKQPDAMCDPAYTGNARNGNNMSGALPNSPLSGAWFSAQFRELMANAYPPL